MLKKRVNNQNYEIIDILGVKVDFVNTSKAISRVEKWMKTNKKYQIVTPNPEQIVLAQRDYRFKKILNKASLRIPDGIGLIWAAKWLYRSSFRSGDRNLFAFRIAKRIKAKLSILSSALANMRKTSQICLPLRERSTTAATKLNLQRLTGIDLMLAMCKLAAQKKWRVFLLGGENNVAKKAAAIVNSRTMKQWNNELKVDYFEGSKNIKKESRIERQETIERINKFKPHFLFVAYGAPEQEKWICDNLPKLNIKIAMGVGGAFDYLAGTIQRAPFYIRSLGFEWFWRLVHQPWRIRRQLALVKFVWLILKTNRITSESQ